MSTDIELDDLLERMERTTARLRASGVSSKAAAILAGADNYETKGFDGRPFLADLAAWKRDGDYEAGARVKAVLGTSAATGQSIIPNNFVADVVERVTARNVWRQVLNVVPGITGKGVDIPYEDTSVLTGQVSSFGSNKTIADFSLGTVTATLYTVAQIVDVGNQLLRQSEGAAERLVRSRLARSMSVAEQGLIVSGTGSSQPYGLTTAFGAYGGTAYDTTLSSETRAAAIGRAIGALETRGATDGVAIVVSSTDYFEMAVETLGTSGSGGWALDPAGGATTPRTTLWGVPVVRDPLLTAGTGYVGAFGQVEFYTGQDMTVDVTTEANTRWDRNVTGFRIEEEVAIDWRPAVFNGWVQRVIGI